MGVNRKGSRGHKLNYNRMERTKSEHGLVCSLASCAKHTKFPLHNNLESNNKHRITYSIPDSLDIQSISTKRFQLFTYQQ